MARQMMDIALDTNNDLAIVDGDFVIVESTAAHQTALILDGKGDYKQNPTIAVGAFDYLNDEDVQGLVRAISVEFTRDGMDVAGVSLDKAGIINSNAHYK